MINSETSNVQSELFFNLGLSPHENEKNFQTGNHISQKPLAAQTKAPLRTFPRKFAAIFQISRTNKFPKYASTPIEFLSLGIAYRKLDIHHLFLLWENPSFQALCDCGNTAVVTGFCGISPLSGNIFATAACPRCRKAIHISNFRACNYALKKSATFSQLYFPAYDAEKDSKVQVCKTAVEESPSLSDYFQTSPLFEILIDALANIDFWVQKGKTPEEAWNDRARSLRNARRRMQAQPPENEG